jgi:hypothetical protein
VEDRRLIGHRGSLVHTFEEGHCLHYPGTRTIFTLTSP